MRRSKATGWGLAGLLLSTILAGCGTTGAEPAPPEPVVVVRTVKETPPAELLRCPVAPLGLPTEGEALIPAPWRAAIVRLAKSRAEVTDQLGRVIAFHTGAACPAAGTHGD